MAFGASQNKTLAQERFFRAIMTSSQSLMVTDDTLKLHYASVMFVDPGVQIGKINAILFSRLLPALRRKVSGSLCQLGAHKTLVYSVSVKEL